MAHDLRSTGVEASLLAFTGVCCFHALTVIVPDPAQKGKIHGPLFQGNRNWSCAPSSPRAAGAKEGKTAGFGRTERPRDEGSERFRNTRVPNASALPPILVLSNFRGMGAVRPRGAVSSNGFYGEQGPTTEHQTRGGATANTGSKARGGTRKGEAHRPLRRKRRTAQHCNLGGCASAPPTLEAAASQASEGCYLAKSTALVSRMTVILIWPGYCRFSSTVLATSFESCRAARSSICSGLTMIRISRPAWMA